MALGAPNPTAEFPATQQGPFLNVDAKEGREGPQEMADSFFPASGSSLQVWLQQDRGRRHNADGKLCQRSGLKNTCLSGRGHEDTW